MQNLNDKNILLFGMSNSLTLANKVSSLLGIELSKIQKTVYADGEIILKAEETVRNREVFVIASTCRPTNDNIMELLIFIDSLKRASAKSINIVLSYYGYARQDRKAKGREPITAKLIANLLEVAGIDKMITIDLHNPSIQGFFDIPVDDLRAQYVLAEEIKKENEKLIVVSPDHGGTVRARLLSELISEDTPIAIVDKRRIGPNQTEVIGVIGNVKDSNVVIIDDIIDTGGTIIKAAQTLKQNGAKKIVIAATHGLFSRGFEAFEKADYIDSVIVTDSVENKEVGQYSKLKVVSLAPFISQIILTTINSESISSIYSEMKKKLIPSYDNVKK